jgi:hypothetical protein
MALTAASTESSRREPRGLTDSARHILDVDVMIDAAVEVRDAAAGAYDRYFHITEQTKEALEILLAHSELIEAADFQMRTGVEQAPSPSTIGWSHVRPSLRQRWSLAAPASQQRFAVCHWVELAETTAFLI